MKILHPSLTFWRVQPAIFEELLARLGPRCTKEDTLYRKTIEPGLKITLILHYLASGGKYASMKIDFIVPPNTMSVIVREVCHAIVDYYKEDDISCTTFINERRTIAEMFARRWNVPHAREALDEKHFAFRKPVEAFRKPVEAVIRTTKASLPLF